MIKKFEELYKNHLYRPNVIGDEKNALSKTLIDHVLENIPNIHSKLKKNEDGLG